MVVFKILRALKTSSCVSKSLPCSGCGALFLKYVTIFFMPAAFLNCSTLQVPTRKG